MNAQLWLVDACDTGTATDDSLEVLEDDHDDSHVVE